MDEELDKGQYYDPDEKITWEQYWEYKKFWNARIERMERREKKREEIIKKFNSMTKEEQKEFAKTKEYQDFVKSMHKKQTSSDKIKNDGDMQLIKSFSNKYFYNKGFSDGTDNAIKVIANAFNHSEEELKHLFDNL